ncbi:Protein kinase superfamily protein containing Leucine-rich repeats [Klebsormidium nitens]|uniref:Protein kinase superfamily protein containing Leucine-rich repeats n=1 Tax=Klebsormidium nitens TaxID=105231 RepID=A0A1Y1INL6_KLENI|nr:Protein kinase superfamily protein containing Leucine-rich repeats [Klebsormidium nitens]|eukprot:GAQ92334.1 Protein kinase superfamily protein containing Leucine-rich repeats [Klebsormidium nitens]
MLLLVALWWFSSTCKVHPATIEDIGSLVDGPLWNQTKLNLNSKGLSEPIPPQLGRLTNLTYLDLSYNSLFGPIPPELGNLTSLQNLYIYKNSLSGPIPPQLGNLTSLGNLAGLQYLDLSSNNLSGSVPSGLDSLTNLTSLDLSHNSLSGPIPPQLGSVTNLKILWLNNNSLSGPIPPTLSRFRGISFFPGNSGLCCLTCSITGLCADFPPPAPSSPPPLLQPLLPVFAFPPPPALPSLTPSLQPLPPVFAFPPPNAPPFVAPVLPSLPPSLTPQPTPTLGPNQAPPSSSTSVGPIVGGVLAGAALLVAAATIGFCLYCRKGRKGFPAAVPSLEEGDPKNELHGAIVPAPPAPTGSFGTVYKGVLQDGSFVAIKRLETRPGRRDVEEQSWKAEVEALDKVWHVNLVPLLGVRVERGERLLIFDFFPRGSLDRQLHHPGAGEVVLIWGDRMNIARGVCQGFIYLHNHIRPPMVHRDIKAANILLTEADPINACIADFGLAHLVQDTGGKTSTMVKGTVPYMAPEYLHGGARFLSPKCDVYSFGMLLLELISERPAVRQLESGVIERLLKVAMNLVTEGRELELVDPVLGRNSEAEEARNYIHVALACLRTDPSARPTMEDVGSLLARASVVDASFRQEEIWDSEGSSGYLGSLGSSTAERSVRESTVQVASRFVTPR